MTILSRRWCLASLLLILTQLNSVFATDALQFTETELGEVREGYVTLSWNELPRTSEYQLLSAQEQSVYRGALPEAFVSGLADGEYEFHVVALDEYGTEIGRSIIPAVVRVKHWSLTLAGLLFACGLVVFVAIIGFIAFGTMRSKHPTSSFTEGGAP